MKIHFIQTNNRRAKLTRMASFLTSSQQSRPNVTWTEAKTETDNINAMGQSSACYSAVQKKLNRKTTMICVPRDWTYEYTVCLPISAVPNILNEIDPIVLFRWSWMSSIHNLWNTGTLPVHFSDRKVWSLNRHLLWITMVAWGGTYNPLFLKNKPNKRTSDNSINPELSSYM